MCFAPQLRALLQHLNFQKCSGAVVSCTFWLGNVLRATTPYTFSTPQRGPNGATKACTFWHRNLQTFSEPFATMRCNLPRWLRTRRFSEPTFRLAGTTKHWKKHSVSRLSYLFAHLHLLSSDSFSSIIFSLLLFHLSILSEIWLLNFLQPLPLLLLLLIYR